MKKYLILAVALLFALNVTAQRKTVTDKLQVTSVKNAEVLATDAKGNVVAGTMPEVDLSKIETQLTNIDERTDYRGVDFDFEATPVLINVLSSSNETITVEGNKVDDLSNCLLLKFKRKEPFSIRYNGSEYSKVLVGNISLNSEGNTVIETISAINGFYYGASSFTGEVYKSNGKMVKDKNLLNIGGGLSSKFSVSRYKLPIEVGGGGTGFNGLVGVTNAIITGRHLKKGTPLILKGSSDYSFVVKITDITNNSITVKPIPDADWSSLPMYYGSNYWGLYKITSYDEKGTSVAIGKNALAYNRDLSIGSGSMTTILSENNLFSEHLVKLGGLDESLTPDYGRKAIDISTAKDNGVLIHTNGGGRKSISLISKNISADSLMISDIEANKKSLVTKEYVTQKLSNVNVTETDPIFSAWNKDYNDLINKPNLSNSVIVPVCKKTLASFTPNYILSSIPCDVIPKITKVKIKNNTSNEIIVKDFYRGLYGSSTSGNSFSVTLSAYAEKEIDLTTSLSVENNCEGVRVIGERADGETGFVSAYITFYAETSIQEGFTILSSLIE